MIKKIIFISFSLLLLSNSEASAWSNLRPSLIVGAGYSRISNAQNLWLATTPAPGLENNYTSGGKQRGSFLLGLAFDKTLATNLQTFNTAIGMEVDYLRNPSITGTVHPMVNVAPNFDTLNYSYNMTAYLLQATAKLSNPDIFHNLGGYLQAGVGGAINYLSDYSEVSPRGSSAAPMLSPFRSKATASLVYSIGAGISYPVGESVEAAFGYRYINSGKSGLKKSPVQQTGQTLNFSPLSHQFLIFTLSA